MSFGNKGDLKQAIKDWADATDVDAYLDDFVALSTALFNYGSDTIEPLRYPTMLATSALTMTGGAGDLPADYLQYRTVVWDGSLRRALEYLPPSAEIQQFPYAQTGIPSTFTIVDNQIVVYPSSDETVNLTYYAAIPDMATDADTNWLLTANPSLYLHAGLLHLALLRRDDDLAQRSAGLVSSYLAGMRKTGMRHEFARAGTRLRIAP